MIREMSPARIDELLRRQLVGRIGCHAEGTTYIVPLHYVYEEGRVFGQTVFGMKLRLIRQNPRVCFEVDRYEGLFEWESVIAWGSFRELSGEEAQQANESLLQKLRRWAAVHDETIHTILDERFLRSSYIEGRTPVVFSIDIDQRTGRYETR